MIGTAILMILGCAGCVVDADASESLIQSSASFGLAVVSAIMVSDQDNYLHLFIKKNSSRVSVVSAEPT